MGADAYPASRLNCILPKPMMITAKEETKKQKKKGTLNSQDELSARGNNN